MYKDGDDRKLLVANLTRSDGNYMEDYDLTNINCG